MVVHDAASHALEDRFEAARVAAIAATDRYRGATASAAQPAGIDRGALADQAWRETAQAVRSLERFLDATDPRLVHRSRAESGAPERPSA